VPVAVGQGKSCPEGSVGLGSGLILQVILWTQQHNSAGKQQHQHQQL
jgi:hypothetical protein